MHYSHPVHPALVHFPIAFLSLTYGLDTLHGLATPLSMPIFRDLKPYLVDISRASHYANILGILTTLPAIVTGSAELIGMYRSNGLYEKVKRESDGQVVQSQINPKVALAVSHAALNDISLAISVYNWYTRRNVPDFMPSNANMLLSALALPGLMLSGYLGGAMVYKYGVGVMRQGEAARIKKESQSMEMQDFDGQTQVKIKKGE